MSKTKRLNRDHAKKTQRPMVEDRVIAEHLTALLTPTIKSQSQHFRELGLRDRILTLPLMVAAVLTLLWRDVPGVSELTRLLETEGFLWCGPTKVSQQALSQRFLTFPAILFERIFHELLPNLKLRWSNRHNRPLPESVQFTLSRKVWHSYLTSVLEPEILPPYVVIDLYQKRWRIEDAFNVVKRLLGLSYLWTGSINGIKLQIWATWLFYAVLVDLGDAVADELSLPFDRISLEMIYRGLYYFHGASSRGETHDPVEYFSNPDIQKCLGIVKRQRKPKQKLIIAPFPDKQRGCDQFFFQSSPKTSLTASL